jgi:hypothetical protein
MPRYFFNFEGVTGVMPDLVGRELISDVAARGEAKKIAADLAAADAIEGRAPTYDWIEVVDSYQRPITRFRLGQAVREPNRLS